MYVPQMMMSAWTILVTTPASTMKALSHVNAMKDIDSKAVHRVQVCHSCNTAYIILLYLY